MTTHRRLVTGVSAVALTTMLFAACGGGGKNLEEAVQEAVDTLPAELTIPSDLTLPTDLTLPMGGSIPTGGLGTIPSDFDLSGACSELLGGWTSAMDAASAALSGSASSGDIDMAAYFDSLVAAVPADISDDVKVIADAWAGWSQALADHNDDITALLSDPDAMAAMEAMSSSEVTAASEAVAAYFEQACGALP